MVGLAFLAKPVCVARHVVFLKDPQLVADSSDRSFAHFQLAQLNASPEDGLMMRQQGIP